MLDTPPRRLSKRSVAAYLQQRVKRSLIAICHRPILIIAIYMFMTHQTYLPQLFVDFAFVNQSTIRDLMTQLQEISKAFMFHNVCHGYRYLRSLLSATQQLYSQCSSVQLRRMLTSPVMFQRRLCLFLFLFVFPDQDVQLGEVYQRKYSRGSDSQTHSVKSKPIQK